MPYQIVTDSTVDISLEMAQKLAIDVLPLSFLLEGAEYRDNFGADMPPHTFYERVRAGNMPTTSMINTDRFLTHFRGLLERGTDVLYLGFSSALSGTCQCGTQAAAQLAEEFPDRKVIAIDTLCASMGEGLIVHEACLKRDAGMGIEELAAWVETNKHKVVHWFTVDDIKHLYRGGRVTAAQAVLGSLIKIKPVLHVDEEGRLIPMEKVIGRKKSLATIVERLVERFDHSCRNVFVSHGDVLEEAQAVAEMIKARLPEVHIEINTIGPVVGAHSGPGTMAIFCFGTAR